LLPGEYIVSISSGALSAYAPPNPSVQAPREFEYPMKLYILETVERDARRKRLRQGIVALALVGIFASQWPVSLSSANAVSSVVVKAQASLSNATTILPERLAFAGGLQSSF
jgi:hypothetical protein